MYVKEVTHFWSSFLIFFCQWIGYQFWIDLEMINSEKLIVLLLVIL